MRERYMLTPVEEERAFRQAVPPLIAVLGDRYGLKSMEFLPREGSPLRVEIGAKSFDRTVKLAADPFMSPFVLERHRWQVEELEFAKRVCIGVESITLIDVGANMGLFSRQLLVALPAIAEVFAYEPEPRNFACLVHNLEPFRKKVKAIEAALSDKAGRLEFYLNPENVGNFSFNLNAMPANHSKIEVLTRDTAIECAAWMDGGRRIFYKSDTEGFDEIVAARIRPEVWPQVFAGIMEVLRVRKPQFDTAVLASVLDNFPNKIFLANADTKVSEERVTTAEVMSFLQENDHQHRDLGFWR
jgi:FkbM family methyltransferase